MLNQHFPDSVLLGGDRQLLDAIIRYNEDDCRATHHLKQWITKFIDSKQNAMSLS